MDRERAANCTGRAEIIQAEKREAQDQYGTPGVRTRRIRKITLFFPRQTHDSNIRTSRVD
jgi:hypothetical protein